MQTGSRRAPAPNHGPDGRARRVLAALALYTAQARDCTIPACPSCAKAPAVLPPRLYWNPAHQEDWLVACNNLECTDRSLVAAASTVVAAKAEWRRLVADAHAGRQTGQEGAGS